jgi:hypothetical protein
LRLALINQVPLYKGDLGGSLATNDTTGYIKQRNGYAISLFENPYWVWFSIHKSVTTLLWIGITSAQKLAKLGGLVLQIFSI